MSVPGSGRALREDLLAAVGTIASTSAVGVTTNVAIGMADIVAIFLVERIVRDFAEPLPPKDQAFVQVEADSFEEESVLKAAVMLQMSIAAKRAVKVGHAGREMLGQGIDVAGRDVGADGGRRLGEIGGIGGDEVLREVVEDRRKTFVLVQARKGTRRELHTKS